jgi:hypothetical protein
MYEIILNKKIQESVEEMAQSMRSDIISLRKFRIIVTFRVRK